MSIIRNLTSLDSFFRSTIWLWTKLDYKDLKIDLTGNGSSETWKKNARLKKEKRWITVKMFRIQNRREEVRIFFH